MLTVNNLSYIYQDKTKALNNVSFNVNKGEKVFFHGANGAGKTTLFHCLTGLYRINSGEIIINNSKIKKNKDLINYIGFVFQNSDDQLISNSVYDEIAFAPTNKGLALDEIIKITDDNIKLLNLEELKSKPPHFLSYGQKKRVCIASVLAMEQSIIIMDEPTAGLDSIQTIELINIIETLANKGITLLISTHDTDFSLNCADRIIVMDKGIIAANDNPNKIFKNTALLEKSSLIKPLIFDIYEYLLENNYLISDKIPKNIIELKNNIKKL